MYSFFFFTREECREKPFRWYCSSGRKRYDVVCEPVFCEKRTRVYLHLFYTAIPNGKNSLGWGEFPTTRNTPYYHPGCEKTTSETRRTKERVSKKKCDTSGRPEKINAHNIRRVLEIIIICN